MQRPGERRTEWLAGFAIVLLIAVAVIFLGRFAPAQRLLMESSRPAAAAVAVIAACVGFGFLGIVGARRVFLFVTREADDSEVSITDALLIGFAVLGTITAAVAWTALAIDTVIVIVTAAAAAIGLVVLWRSRAAWHGPIGSPSVLVAAIPALLAFAQAITPANSPDELIYKLAIPHAYQLYGRMLELPLTTHSYVTMADQMASLPALILGGGISARLLHFAMFLATLVAVHRLASRIDPRAAPAVVGVLAWTPAFMITAGWAWNDWSTLGLLIVAFDRYERWTDSTTPSDAATAFAALGCAASVKYTALPWLLGMMLLATVRHRWAPRSLAAAAGLTFLFGAFFYVRNVIWTGSPIAPLLLPNAPAVANYRSGTPFEGWTNLAKAYDVFDARISDESLGILFPVAALLGFAAVRSRERWLRDLVVLSAIQIPIVLTAAPVSRIAANAFVPIALAGTIITARAAAGARPLLRVVIGSVVAVAMVAQLTLVLFVMSSYEIMPYLTGQETATAYLQRTRAFMRPYAWIERFTPSSARVLLLGENRTFYLQRPFIAGGNLDGPRIASWLSTFRSPDALSHELRAMRITHVLLHTPWYRVGGASPGMLEKEYLLEVSEPADSVLRSFLQSHARLVYRDGEYLIFELVSS